MRIYWSEDSLYDLESICDYISISNPRNADKFIIELFDSTELMLGNFPRSGRKIPGTGDESLREIIHGNYRIMYKIQKEEIRILTVRNSNRAFNSEELQ